MENEVKKKKGRKETKEEKNIEKNTIKRKNKRKNNNNKVLTPHSRTSNTQQNPAPKQSPNAHTRPSLHFFLYLSPARAVYTTLTKFGRAATSMKVTVQLRVNSATYHPNMAGERDLCTTTPI